jgi:hypothetical protein
MKCISLLLFVGVFGSEARINDVPSISPSMEPTDIASVSGTSVLSDIKCLEDGNNCIPGDTCYNCCTGAFDNNGYTCGGICIEDGKECLVGEDCHLCCNSYNIWFKTGKSTCGYEQCYKDGDSCIPYESCYNCCSGGAFTLNGTTCGGECLKSGTDCDLFSTCGSCCDGASYWDTNTNSMKCGYNGCYEDGHKCMPGLDCSNCCSGGAYNGDGTTCGGECLIYGTECEATSTCGKCCDGLSYWDYDVKAMKCGMQKCLEDGADCLIGHSCHNCCSSSFEYDNGSSTCGGTCLNEGEKCDFFSTCNNCCFGGLASFNKETDSFECSMYMEFPSMVPLGVVSKASMVPSGVNNSA